MINQTAALRRLLADEAFIHLPVAYDALGGRLIESTGFKSAYVGGFVTGGSRCTSEPLLTLDEQVRVAGDVARAVKIPVLADAVDELKARHPEIPWPKVAGIGNVLRHEYEHVAHDVLWHVVRDDLPPLEKACREELATAGK